MSFWDCKRTLQCWKRHGSIAKAKEKATDMAVKHEKEAFKKPDCLTCLGRKNCQPNSMPIPVCEELRASTSFMLSSPSSAAVFIAIHTKPLADESTEMAVALGSSCTLRFWGRKEERVCLHLCSKCDYLQPTAVVLINDGMHYRLKSVPTSFHKNFLIKRREKEI